MLQTLLPGWLRVTVLLLLLGFLVYWGLFPAFTRMDTDFPNYYTAGRIVASGGEITRLYDDMWFQQQIQANGMELQGKFSPFPPPTALLFVPFANSTPVGALQIMTVLNIVMVCACVVLLGKLRGIDFQDSLFIILFGGIGLGNCFRFGQLYIAVSLSIILCFYLYTIGRPILSGVSLALFIPIKYFPVLFLVYFVMMKEWKVVTATIITTALIILSSILYMGWEIHEQFLYNVLGQHLQSQLTLQDPFASTFQSFDSILRRFFLRDDVLNPIPVLDEPFIFYSMKFAIITTIVIVTAASVRKLRTCREGVQHIAFALLGIGGLLIAPATATYHAILLWLPVALLLRFFHEQKNRLAFWLTGGCFAAIGFIPYSLFRQFDGQGLLSILAYPRLALMLGLFIVVTGYVRGMVAPSVAFETKERETSRG